MMDFIFIFVYGAACVAATYWYINRRMKHDPAYLFQVVDKANDLGDEAKAYIVEAAAKARARADALKADRAKR